MEIVLKLAGIATFMVAVANLFTGKKLGLKKSLSNTELFFQQVYKVHHAYIVGTLVILSLAYLFATEEMILKQSRLAQGVVWFSALFWSVRVLAHLFYYDQTLMRANPWWNALFLTVFSYLAAVFLIMITM